MTRVLAAAALAVSLAAVASADSSSAQLTVGVTVVRSCSVDVRPADAAAPQVRLTCTSGAQSTVQQSSTVPTSVVPAASDEPRLVTLNF